jgi:hypothetical protein
MLTAWWAVRSPRAVLFFPSPMRPSLYTRLLRDFIVVIPPAEPLSALHRS